LEDRVRDWRTARRGVRKQHRPCDHDEAEAAQQQKTVDQLCSQVPSLSAARAAVQFIGNLGESEEPDKTAK
jgi:hypothetical protein